jgi:adenylate cyclase
MPKQTQPVLFSLFILFFGLLAGAVSYHYDLEEKVGLKVLFTLRGTRTPPSEALVVAMDKQSIRGLELDREMEKWPRYLHADLIDRLHRDGAGVIAFDVIFDEARMPVHDQAFASAIDKAGNVVLGAFLQKERVPLSNVDAVLETLFTPIPLLAEPAAGYGPFPLPKVPLRVSQVWLFKGEEDPMPTMPVVAFQVWALWAYPEFMALLKEVDEGLYHKLPPTREHVLALEHINLLIKKLRELFNNHPGLSRSLNTALHRSTLSPMDQKVIHAMISLYGGEASRYVNFYGSAGTMPTVSYNEVLNKSKAGSSKTFPASFIDKAIFVGRSEHIQVQKEDVFYTVFSKRSGIDISGVEIAAATFANLLEDCWIRPLNTRWHLVLILVWGGLAGTLCYLFRPLLGGVSLVGGSVVYVLICQVLFNNGFYWVPIVVPVLMQGPMAFFASLFVKYIDIKKERENIRKAFGYYLPEHVVRRLAKDVASIPQEHRLVYGVVLSTDAQQYTQMAETMEPTALRELINRYYEILFAPVRANGGYVSDVIGDAMMAIWTAPEPDPSQCAAACRAALEIREQIEKFKETQETHRLPTRIGIHAGLVTVGSVGAGDHFEYRAVGDIVNTAARLEGLNKHLGTKILVSSDVTDGLDEFLTLRMGDFLLSGKSKSVGVAELICRHNVAGKNQQDCCKLFDEALDAFQKKSFDSARLLLKNVIEIDTENGPAKFFIEECNKCQQDPIGDIDTSVIRMSKK